ncbi:MULTISPECIES: cell wall metabolism sensor histidine kinase WalK [unclassified Planococcus (in: firmicutes)]|uniref:sensor histidine kinase n=1 Tax=Planococcus TaxID=1372 RepID=UPI000C33DFF2|nr:MULTISPECIES: HAMP domain-containing sensor histidine kinase [unclassified Planococcus (in: firmicutes)]AUD14244.1 two-component sensor histidine kinase [Planococcus sp. MB-3u-03]PKG48275.1 two-component sensor histidine kinase [Planococcus sp. Urea-trap-24]PKG92122.1 two-component sensor histidine kinase [Planococcus sp. Urea-3u-39]PKH42972.1 two-component sensor histidine kinase [Planococcus sp. MB-3u-09]
MKLKHKIHLSSTLLMFFVLLILAVVIYYSFSSLAYETEVERLEAEVEVMVAKFNANNNEELPDNILRAYVPVDGLIKEKNGSSGLLNTIIQDPSVNVEFPNDVKGASGRMAVEGEQFAYVTAPVIWPGGEVVELIVAQSLREVTANLATLRLVLISVTLLSMIPIFLSSALLGRVLTRPIEGLTGTMRRIQRDGSFEKLPIAGESRDELSQMGVTFNEMIGLLEENYRKQEEFVSNASHELKTPLTVISSYADLLQRRGSQDPALQEEALTAIRNETERMRQLIEQLLHIARRSQAQMDWQKTDLQPVLRQVMTAMNASYDREFRLQAQQSLIVETDVQQLKQLLYILLDNARKYSEASVDMEAGTDGAVYIKIRDYGVGIPKESLPHVFERFYRVDKARSRETGGFGLGLSLAKELADSLHLQLEIDSIEQLGTTVTIVFSGNFNVGQLQSGQEG